MRKAGFTLIELSIVLVIIGLITGGVLAGKELIHAAEIRAVVSQSEKFTTAVNTFRLKYNCLPGDCTNADAFGLTSYNGVASPNGNNDQIISGLTGETFNGMHQLGETGLLADVRHGMLNGFGPGTYIEPALGLTNSFGKHGAWYIGYLLSDSATSVQRPGHYYWLGAYLGGGGGPAAFVMPIDAFAIDSKIDDGYPRTGIMLATSNAAASISSGPYHYDVSDIGPAGATSNFCVATGTPPYYNTLNSSRAAGSFCAVTIAAKF